jgi:4-hydroxy-tetrahydrodipicolinate reductase
MRAALEEVPGFVLGAAWERGQPLDGAKVDAFVEFTNGAAVPNIAKALGALGTPWVSGTTGLDEAGRGALREAATTIPVLWSPNLSLGVAVLSRLLSQAARLLPPGWEMELIETHHTAKRDAPSGTALDLARRWMEVRGGVLRHGRSGTTGLRPAAEVGVHALRLPDVVGEHTVRIGGPREMVELGHRAFDRAAFAHGALAAAGWLVQRKAGLYTMDDWVEDRLREVGERPCA